MSAVAFLDSHKLTKKPSCRRNNHFSGAIETNDYIRGATASSKAMKLEERLVMVGGRKSIDVPMKISLPSHPLSPEKNPKEKKFKQPVSPGGRLATFLNSLFSQRSSKKKSKSTMKEKEQSPSGWRRRSSISHFEGLNNMDPKSIHSSSTSVFRTEHSHSQNPKKVNKDFRGYSDHKKQPSFPKCNGLPRSVSFYLRNDVSDEKFKYTDDFIGKSKKFNNGFLEKDRKYGSEHIENYSTWVDMLSTKEKDLRKAEEADDGWGSDTSSDLFELQNYDLDVYSNGLPVYESTQM